MVVNAIAIYQLRDSMDLKIANIFMAYLVSTLILHSQITFCTRYSVTAISFHVDLL